MSSRVVLGAAGGKDLLRGNWSQELEEEERPCGFVCCQLCSLFFIDLVTRAKTVNQTVLLQEL